MYCSVETLIQTFDKSEIVRLSNEDGYDGEVVNTAVVDELIKQASAYIDTFLSERYTTPLSETPDIIANICETIVYYRLKQRKGAITNYDKVIYDYEDAKSYLNKLSGGKVKLDVEASTQAGEVSIGNYDASSEIDFGGF